MRGTDSSYREGPKLGNHHFKKHFGVWMATESNLLSVYWVHNRYHRNTQGLDCQRSFPQVGTKLWTQSLQWMRRHRFDPDGTLCFLTFLFVEGNFSQIRQHILNMARPASPFFSRVLPNTVAPLHHEGRGHTAKEMQLYTLCVAMPCRGEDVPQAQIIMQEKTNRVQPTAVLLSWVTITQTDNHCADVDSLMLLLKQVEDVVSADGCDGNWIMLLNVPSTFPVANSATYGQELHQCANWQTKSTSGL